MPVRIRLSRGGAKKRPFYRIVVADSRRSRDGKFIDQIGTYNPMLPKDSKDRVKMDVDKAKEWISKGAQPSDRISIFLSKLGVMDKPVINPIDKQPIVDKQPLIDKPVVNKQPLENPIDKPVIDEIVPNCTAIAKDIMDGKINETNFLYLSPQCDTQIMNALNNVLSEIATLISLLLPTISLI